MFLNHCIFFLFNHTTIVISACVEEGRPVFDRAIPKQNFTLQNPFFIIIFTYFWISPVTFLYPIKTKRVHCILKEISPKTIRFLMPPEKVTWPHVHRHMTWYKNKHKKSVNIRSSLVNRGTIIFTLLYTHLLTNKAISDYLCPLVAEGTKI